MEKVRCYCRTGHKIQRCILYQATTLTRKQDKWTAQASPVNVSRMCLKASKTTGPVSDIFSSGAGGLFGLNGYIRMYRGTGYGFQGPESWIPVFIEQFSYDLAKQKQQTNGNWAIWLVYRTDTNARSFGWLSERSGEKTLCPRTFLEIALTSNCNTIGQLIEQCLLHIRVFFGMKRNSPCFDLFHPLADKALIVIEPFFHVIRKSFHKWLKQDKFL